MYTTQGTSHIETLVDAPPMEGIPGKLLTCSAEDLKIEIGLPGPILQHDYNRLQSAVTPYWLMIHGNLPTSAKLKWRKIWCSGKKMACLKKRCLYLQAMNLEDFTKADGF